MHHTDQWRVKPGSPGSVGRRGALPPFPQPPEAGGGSEVAGIPDREKWHP